MYLRTHLIMSGRPPPYLNELLDTIPGSVCDMSEFPTNENAAYTCYITAALFSPPFDAGIKPRASAHSLLPVSEIKSSASNRLLS